MFQKIQNSAKIFVHMWESKCECVFNLHALFGWEWGRKTHETPSEYDQDVNMHKPMC